MKRGQVMGQPIIFVFYAIVAILVLFLGFKWVVNVSDQGNEAEYVIFMNNLESEIERIASYNSGSTILLDELRIPKGVEEICFADWDLTQTGVVNDEILSGYIFAVDGGEKNIFFAGEKIKALSSDFSLSVSPLCDSTLDGKLNFKLSKEGSSVFVRSLS
ncbi:hypothetical protein HOD61_02930 [archaeon]|jgi:hypothetical protein|nr:hypothetical protein [archaeon]